MPNGLIIDATKVLDVRAVELTGALADPREVGGEVVVALATRHLARLSGLVVEIETLVRDEKLNAR